MRGGCSCREKPVAFLSFFFSFFLLLLLQLPPPSPPPCFLLPVFFQFIPSSFLRFFVFFCFFFVFVVMPRFAASPMRPSGAIVSPPEQTMQFRATLVCMAMAAASVAWHVEAGAFKVALLCLVALVLLIGWIQTCQLPQLRPHAKAQNLRVVDEQAEKTRQVRTAVRQSTTH